MPSTNQCYTISPPTQPPNPPNPPTPQPPQPPNPPNLPTPNLPPPNLRPGHDGVHRKVLPHPGGEQRGLHGAQVVALGPRESERTPASPVNGGWGRRGWGGWMGRGGMGGGVGGWGWGVGRGGGEESTHFFPSRRSGLGRKERKKTVGRGGGRKRPPPNHRAPPNSKPTRYKLREVVWERMRENREAGVGCWGGVWVGGWVGGVGGLGGWRLDSEPSTVCSVEIVSLYNQKIDDTVLNVTNVSPRGRGNISMRVIEGF